MEKDRKRAIRRHHIARLKNTRKNYFNATWRSDPKQLGRIVQYPAMCSCTMCGNERKWFGYRTLDEKRGFDKMKDGIDDYFNGQD